MGEHIRAVVKPELLVWARKSARYQVHEAAKKASVSAERLREWESGDSSPTINQLRTLANMYKRPLAVFFLPEPSRQFDAMRDFRRLPGTLNAEYTPELVLAIRRARFRREIAVELAEELELEVPRLHFDPSPFTGDVNRLADAGRKLLNLELGCQIVAQARNASLRNRGRSVEFDRSAPSRTCADSLGPCQNSVAELLRGSANPNGFLRHRELCQKQWVPEH